MVNRSPRFISKAREWVTSQPLLPQGARLTLAKTDAAWNETFLIAGLGWTFEAQNRVSSHSSPAHR